MGAVLLAVTRPRPYPILPKYKRGVLFCQEYYTFQVLTNTQCGIIFRRMKTTEIEKETNITARVRVREILKKHKMSVETASHVTGLTRSTLYNLMQNRRVGVNLETLAKMMKGFGLKSFDDLLELTD